MSRNLLGQTFFNQYRVDAFIASGGMGTVYRAWDLKRNAYLALKVLHEDLLEEPAILKRFKREARALEKLTHPNIVPFYGFYQTSSFAFLLEAYIDGPSLKDIIRHNHHQPFAINDTLTYLKVLCAALGYAHSYGVIHCDVKPGNVMLDNGGNIYLADFGIARHAESTTTTFATVGTAAYMAPEQIRGDPVDATTDVYALGVLFFELLTGRRPFIGDEKHLESSGTTAGERLRYAHLNLPPPDPRIFNPRIPEALANLIQQTMAKDQENRPKGAMEFYLHALEAAGVNPNTITDRALNETLAASSSFAPPTIPGHESPDRESITPAAHVRSKTPLDQRKKGIGIVAIASILVLGFLLLMGSKFVGKGGAPDSSAQIAQALTQSQIAAGMPALMTETVEEEKGPSLTDTLQIPVDFPTATNLPEPTVTPSPIPSQTPLPGGIWGQIVFTCQIFKNDQKNQICLMNADGSNQIRLTTRDNVDHAWPSLSPDGQSVVYAANTTGEYEIYEISLASRNPIQLTSSLRNSAPSISPDGKYIVYIHKVGDFRQLWLMDRNGNNQHRFVGSDQWGAWDGAWSPDSRQISFASDMDGEIELYTANISGLNLKKVTNVTQDFPSDQRLRGRSDWSPDGNWLATYLGNFWHWEIYLISSDGAQSNIITAGGNNLAPSFSPNGEWITFTSYRDRYGDDNGCEVYIMRLDGSDVRRLTDNNYCDWQPRWGP